MAALLDSQANFLHALQEHVDELWLILKSLVDPSSAMKKPVFADRYVLENKLPGAKTFQAAISDYKRTLRIVNKLKHQQGYLRGVAIWLPDRPHLGYFLEEPDSQGYIGPSPEIHPDRGAFSFASDLRCHILNVYLCSEKLANATKTALGSRGAQLQAGTSAAVKGWADVVTRVSALPEDYFPKEVTKSAANFVLEKTTRTLTIDYPIRLRLNFPARINTSCSTVIDGHTPKFKVPFP